MDFGLIPRTEKFNLKPFINNMNRYSYDISGQFGVLMNLNTQGIANIDFLIGNSLYDSNSLVKSVNIDSLNFSEIREWMGSSWTYTPGNHELQQVEIEMRDINGGVLYSNWKALLYKLKNRYPEEQQWTIKVIKLNTVSFRHLTGGEVQENCILYTKKAILRNVGGERLDSEDSSFTNFTLTFFFDPFPFDGEVSQQSSSAQNIDTSSTTFG